jgi:hypothetical protein
MVQTIKVRKNKSDTKKHMGGGNIDEAIKAMISTFTRISKMYCSDTIMDKFGRSAIKTVIDSVQEDVTSNDLIKSLGIKATMKELIQTCLESLKCKDIKTITTILPTLLVFDKIQEFLQTPDEAAKKTTEFYKILHDIVTNKDNQELVCRIFNNLKSKNYVTDDHIKIFTTFIGGDPKMCESIDLGEADVPSTGAEQNEGSSPTFSERIKNMNSSLFGKRSNDNDETPNDKRCGEKQIVKKSIIIGEYCAPPVTKVVEAAKPEQPTTEPSDASTTETRPAEPTNMKGGNRRKYNRANKSKKNKKSKSNKSKRSNK